MDFKLKSKFKPSGDQPQAIDKIVAGLNNGKAHQTLLGVTGSGKTFTMANVIEKVNRPTLVIAHNKTLAAQLCNEFKEFFPDSVVEYFISYYDYYQPEAYIPSRDVYIEKEADINEEIERLRHRATFSLLTRRDVIIVASVSCIYGLGLPEDYRKGIISLKVGQKISRRDLLLKLERSQYERNDIELKNGRYRVKGNNIDVFAAYDENLTRLEFFGDELERVCMVEPVSGEVVAELDDVHIFPATHYMVHGGLERAEKSIKAELEERIRFFNQNENPVAAQRIKQRTNYDMEMMSEIGYCKGIENYSGYLSNREPGEPPGVLIDFFPDDFITIIDESHVTVPQIRGMYKGDQSRKQSLVDYGFRLPSAKDNRPLKFEEFVKKIGPCIYVSATPGNYELEICRSESGVEIVEQIIRPTGLIDPEVVIKPTLHQTDDLLSEINKRIECKERVLITTLTKRMAEDLSSYLDQKGIKVSYLHSEVKTLDRIDVLHDLRVGKFDVLVGVNLLREGLDLPEVSLVAIMDADKEGFLRNERSLIQTIGRAARNINGKVILYADKLTDSMRKAVRETSRRRKIQIEYNKVNNIVPQSIVKEISDIRDVDRKKIKELKSEVENVSPGTLVSLIAKLERDMQEAAKNLEFELAAVLRDQIKELGSSSYSMIV